MEPNVIISVIGALFGGIATVLSVWSKNKQDIQKDVVESLKEAVRINKETVESLKNDVAFLKETIKEKDFIIKSKDERLEALEARNKELPAEREAIKKQQTKYHEENKVLRKHFEDSKSKK